MNQLPERWQAWRRARTAEMVAQGLTVEWARAHSRAEAVTRAAIEDSAGERMAFRAPLGFALDAHQRLRCVVGEGVSPDVVAVVNRIGGGART